LRLSAIQTLFNKITKGDVLARDMLFATLDTTHRVLPLPSGQTAVLSDTVGFISDLPTSLITAFRATLEEVKEADLLIHVEDQARHLSERASASRTYADMIDAFEISCLTGKGIPELERGIEEVLTRNDRVLNVRVTPAFFSARAWLHQNGQVLRDETGEGGIAKMQVRLSESDAGKFLARYKDLIVN